MPALPVDYAIPRMHADAKSPASREASGAQNTGGVARPYPYFCERMNPDSAVKSVRADYLIAKPDGRFVGERTLTVEGVGCLGEGPGVHRPPISETPADPLALGIDLASTRSGHRACMISSTTRSSIGTPHGRRRGRIAATTSPASSNGMACC